VAAERILTQRKRNRALPARSAGTVLVTGASSGIGASAVELLVTAGFHVAAGARSPDDLERLDAMAGVDALRIDVTDRDAIEEAATVLGDQGDLVGLVNNAGVAISGPIEGVPVDEWRRQLEINVVGQVAVTQAMLPALIANRGRVVNISSISGLLAPPLLGPYAASKFALEAVSDVLRREVGPLGVDVVVIEPGSTATPIWEKSLEKATGLAEQMPPAVRDRYAPLIEAISAGARDRAASGIPPAKVGEVIVRAMTTRRPRTRYRVGTDVKVRGAMARFLPDRAMDALIRRALGDERRP
jgi:NAD(P)-dependent dehydrogenase (short-subunit alcohol dehydrogenase family)